MFNHFNSFNSFNSFKILTLFQLFWWDFTGGLRFRWNAGVVLSHFQDEEDDVFEELLSGLQDSQAVWWRACTEGLSPHSWLGARLLRVAQRCPPGAVEEHTAPAVHSAQMRVCPFRPRQEAEQRAVLREEVDSRNSIFGAEQSVRCDLLLDFNDMPRPIPRAQTPTRDIVLRFLSQNHRPSKRKMKCSSCFFKKKH